MVTHGKYSHAARVEEEAKPMAKAIDYSSTVTVFQPDNVMQ